MPDALRFLERFHDRTDVRCAKEIQQRFQVCRCRSPCNWHVGASSTDACRFSISDRGLAARNVSCNPALVPRTSYHRKRHSRANMPHLIRPGVRCSTRWTLGRLSLRASTWVGEPRAWSRPCGRRRAWPRPLCTGYQIQDVASAHNCVSLSEKLCLMQLHCRYPATLSPGNSQIEVGMIVARTRSSKAFLLVARVHLPSCRWFCWER